MVVRLEEGGDVGAGGGPGGIGRAAVCLLY